jgi:hypothetical protein
VGSVIREAEAGFHRFFHEETVATLMRRMTFPTAVAPIASTPKRD